MRASLRSLHRSGLAAALLLIVGAFTARAQDPYDLNNIEPRDLSNDDPRDLLRLTLERKLGHIDAPEAMVRAGMSGDTTLRPLLKEVVRYYGRDGEEYRSVALAALYALMELGEPFDFFLDYIREHPQDLHSNWIVEMRSAWADSTEYRAFQSLPDTTGIQLHAYRSRWEFVIRPYRSWPKEQQIAFALRFAWIGFAFPDPRDPHPSFAPVMGDRNFDLDPDAIWGRMELRRWYRQDPEAVRSVLVSRINAITQGPGYTPEFREEMARQVEEYIQQIVLASSWRDRPLDSPWRTQADVTPVLECVVVGQDGTFTARFGYASAEPRPVRIARGPNNRLTPAAYAALAVEDFRPTAPLAPPVRPGTRAVVAPSGTAFEVRFRANERVVWTLATPTGPRTATAMPGAPRCGR